MFQVDHTFMIRIEKETIIGIYSCVSAAYDFSSTIDSFGEKWNCIGWICSIGYIYVRLHQSVTVEVVQRKLGAWLSSIIRVVHAYLNICDHFYIGNCHSYLVQLGITACIRHDHHHLCSFTRRPIYNININIT